MYGTRKIFKKKSFSELQPADFLVLGVEPVIEAPDGHHDDAFPRDILEGSGNRDGSALSNQVGIHLEN